jgi:hypothetical protein
VELVRSRYADFGPTLATEMLLERHSIKVGRETLRRWMVAEGLWLSRKQRRTFHQPRLRRECVGELIRIDGSEHRWFEDRGAPCTLLVLSDVRNKPIDATVRSHHDQLRWHRYPRQGANSFGGFNTIEAGHLPIDKDYIVRLVALSGLLGPFQYLLGLTALHLEGHACQHARLDFGRLRVVVNDKYAPTPKLGRGDPLGLTSTPQKRKRQSGGSEVSTAHQIGSRTSLRADPSLSYLS